MARRDVDSTVLRELAAATVRARGDIEGRFNTARSRVDGAPGGWNRGRWDGVPSFIRMELENLDREQRELYERAIKVDLVAAVTALPEALPLSALRFMFATLAGGAFSFFLAPGVVDGFVAKVSEFSKDFQAKNGQAPASADFGKMAGGLFGGALIGFGLGKPTTPGVNGVSRYHGDVVVGGKTLTDAQLVDRAKGIRRAYQDVLGRPPTSAEYDAAMRSGKTLEQIRAELASPGWSTTGTALLQTSPLGAAAILKLGRSGAEFARIKGEDGKWETREIRTVKDHIQAYGCLMTSFAMLLHAKGESGSVTDIYQASYDKRYGAGKFDKDAADGTIQIDDLNLTPGAIAAVSAGFKDAQATLSANPHDAATDLKSMIAANGPVILHVSVGTTDGHWIVVDRVNDDGSLDVRDPLNGARSGVKLGSGADYTLDLDEFGNGTAKYLAKDV